MQKYEVLKAITTLNEEIEERVEKLRNMESDVEAIIQEEKQRLQEQIVGVRWVAEYLDVNRATIYRMVDRGQLHPLFTLPNSAMLFLRAEIEIRKSESLLNKDKCLLSIKRKDKK